MIKEKIHWATITDEDLKNAISLIPDKDFMNTANKNCVENYINIGKKRFE